MRPLPDDAKLQKHLLDNIRVQKVKTISSLGCGGTMDDNEQALFAQLDFLNHIDTSNEIVLPLLDWGTLEVLRTDSWNAAHALLRAGIDRNDKRVQELLGQHDRCMLEKLRRMSGG